MLQQICIQTHFSGTDSAGQMISKTMHFYLKQYHQTQKTTMKYLFQAHNTLVILSCK